MASEVPPIIFEEDGWHDIIVSQENFDDIQKLFAQNRPNAFRTIASIGPIAPNPIRATMPLEINLDSGIFYSVAINPNTPDHIMLFAGHSSRANGAVRFLQRIGFPGTEFPVPKRITLEHIGDIRTSSVEPQLKPNNVAQFPKTKDNWDIREFVGNLKFHLGIATTHEWMRKFELFTLRPILAGVAVVVPFTIGLTQCGGPQPTPVHPTPVTTTISGH